MIHRALMGSLERFFGVLVEHYGRSVPDVAGARAGRPCFPSRDRQNDYAREVVAGLAAAGFRAEGDYRNEKLGFKIRESQLSKVPYALVIGRARGDAAAGHSEGEGEGSSSPPSASRSSSRPCGVKTVNPAK